ncbi:glycosyl transferase [Cellulomonas chitinilytica]|uniref:4,4'-diaponeurosporenoate glycosyltransferase n=1 Tax=Cellulomonas chitinilytica TaxID=398759 RepID=A0A919U4P7_9CELL|nr:glycosyltransferase [Cellulomonas chitinilytica]GIG23662.1 glycosyl transferase [Cellulomonas chitinilytica]
MTAGVEQVVVVVPVRNEAALLGRCLRSVLAAACHVEARRGAVVRVVVVLDDCEDGSETIARGFPAEVHAISARSVGVARATGVAHGLAGALADRARTWIACTDADSAVPTHWLTAQVRHADAGVDVVVGTVRPDPAELSATQLAAWSATRVVGCPNGHVHGANLGVRASVYERVGGFSLQPEHEDVDLVQRIAATGSARIVASDEADVLTSARTVGRTPGGYAAYLRQGPLSAADAYAALRDDRRRPA